MKSIRTPDYPLWQNFLLLAGRVLMGWIFVESGLRKLLGMDSFIMSLTNRRVPYAGVLGWIGAAVEFFGGEPLVLSPEGFGKLVADETVRWEKVVKTVGLAIE